MPQAMGLLLLPWGKAGERSDLRVFPENRLQKKAEQPGADTPLAVAILWQPGLIKRASSSFDLCDRINDTHGI